MSLLLGKRNRETKLFLLCPSLSKSKKFQLVTYDDEKINLGFIAKVFGLDPSTLKLNGYFLSRGVDLISSSVTWKSLLSLFSSKGLSTGRDDHDAIVVTGKVVNNREHEPQDFQSGIDKVIEGENAGSNGGNQLEDINLHKNKKLRESKSEHEPQDFQNGISKVIEGEHAGSNGGNHPEDINLHKNKKLRESKSGEILNALNCKRKQLFEDFNQFKKLKINEDKSDLRNKVDELNGSTSHIQFTCSYTSKNLKRIREDNAIVAANYKRIR